MVSSGCQDVYDEVYKRVIGEGGSKLKATLFARVAQANCEGAGKGDPPDKKDKKK